MCVTYATHNQDAKPGSLTRALADRFHLTELDMAKNCLFSAQEVFQSLQTHAPNLKVLNLSGNFLNGNLPGDGALLYSLEDLNVSENELSIIAPEAAQGWASLRRFHCVRNLLTTLPPTVLAWSQIRAVHLRSNHLVSLPPEIGAWSHLEVLDVGYNKITALPDAIGSCTALKALYVNHNALSALPESLGQCNQLTKLHMGANQINQIPESLFEGLGDSLEELQAFRNKLDTLPESMGKLHKLTRLSLAGNVFKGPMPDCVGGCVALREVHFSNIPKLAGLPDSCGNWTDVEFVSLGGCPGIKALPATAPAGWGKLKELDLRTGGKKDKCKLTAEMMDAQAERGFVLRGGVPPKKKSDVRLKCDLEPTGDSVRVWVPRGAVSPLQPQLWRNNNDNDVDDDREMGLGLGLDPNNSDEDKRDLVWVAEEAPRWTWVWNDTAGHLYGLKGCSSGPLAQDLEARFPGATTRDAHGYMEVAY